MASTHHIRKLHFALRAPDAATAREVQDGVLEMFEGPISSLLEAGLAQWDSEEDVIYLDRLEIDLGQLPRESWSGAFLEKLREKLDEVDLIRGPDKQVAPEQSTAPISRLRMLEEAIVHYLRHGYFNWEGAALLLEEPIERAIARWLRETPEATQRLRALSRQEPTIADRLALQFPTLVQRIGAETDTIEIRPPATGQASAEAEVARAEVKGPRADPMSAPATPIANEATTGRPTDSAAPTMDSTLAPSEDREKGEEPTTSPLRKSAKPDKAKFASKTERNDKPDTRKKAQKHPETASPTLDPSQAKDSHGDPPAAMLRPDDRPSERLPAELERRDSPRPQHQARRVPDMSARESGEWHNEIPKEADSSELEAVIDNAGLVLLAPFLPDFFRANGWLEEDATFAPPNRLEAVFALQYLTRESVECPEWSLLLNRLLCGVDLDLPLPPVIKLTEKTLTEGDELLHAVINHWGALKSTSADGLRQAFLQRQGILRDDDEGPGWRLQVERKSYDLLLERLPWSFSMISFSWMEQPLRVEW